MPRSLFLPRQLLVLISLLLRAILPQCLPLVKTGNPLPPRMEKSVSKGRANHRLALFQWPRLDFFSSSPNSLRRFRSYQLHGLVKKVRWLMPRFPVFRSLLGCNLFCELNAVCSVFPQPEVIPARASSSGKRRRLDVADRSQPVQADPDSEIL